MSGEIPGHPRQGDTPVHDAQIEVVNQQVDVPVRVGHVELNAVLGRELGGGEVEARDGEGVDPESRRARVEAQPGDEGGGAADEEQQDGRQGQAVQYPPGAGMGQHGRHRGDAFWGSLTGSSVSAEWTPERSVRERERERVERLRWEAGQVPVHDCTGGCCEMTEFFCGIGRYIKDRSKD